MSVETKSLEILRQFEKQIPRDRYDAIRDLITHGEWGIALEILHENLRDFNVQASSKQLSEIQALAHEMRRPAASSEATTAKTKIARIGVFMIGIVLVYFVAHLIYEWWRMDFGLHAIPD